MNEYQEAFDSVKEELENVTTNNELYEKLETLQKLVDKATPKKLKKFDWGYCCPECESNDVYDFEYNSAFNYCGKCGQRLDWSDLYAWK